MRPREQHFCELDNVTVCRKNRKRERERLKKEKERELQHGK